MIKESTCGLFFIFANGNDRGLNWYDFHARWQDAALGRFLSVDPLAEKYYSVSPYVYCMNNPIKYVDPDGRDIWELDKDGNIVNRIEDKTQDAFYMVARDADGNYQRTKTTDAEGNEADVCVSFKFGTVTGVKKPMVNVENKDGSITPTELTIFEMKGDGSATEFFEFLADPERTTNVEWSHGKIGSKGSGRNIVGTSHARNFTSVGHYLLATGYTLREVNHNHPSGTREPSRSDLKGAESYHQRNKNTILNIYIHPGQYLKYNQKGLIQP